MRILKWRKNILFLSYLFLWYSVLFNFQKIQKKQLSLSKKSPVIFNLMGALCSRMEITLIVARSMTYVTFGEEPGSKDLQLIMNFLLVLHKNDDSTRPFDLPCGSESEYDELLFGPPAFDGDLEEINIKKSQNKFWDFLLIWDTTYSRVWLL